VQHEDIPASERLARIRSLVSGIQGPLGNGEILTWVSPGSADSVPLQVFGQIHGAADSLQRWGPGGSADGRPVDAADLMAKLYTVTDAEAAQVLVWLLSTTLAYGRGGRYAENKAKDITDALCRLLGHGSSWWTNINSAAFAPARSWNPVTSHTMDAVVTAAGNGVIVTFLAVDED
jgi:hypothetical protein